MEWSTKQIADGVHEIEVPSWHGLDEYIQKELTNYGAYIYRGQREPEWQLIPSIDRISGWSTVKYYPLTRFKNASRGRRGASPTDLTDDEWWALGQHHGLCTPLLDWTESPFIAAFFAFQTSRDPKTLPKPRRIYAIASQQVSKKTEEIKKTNPGTILGGTDAIEVISPRVDDNSRLVSQRGLFTKTLSRALEVEDWVRRHFQNETKGIMIKIDIMESSSDRSTFLKFLNRMNINHLSLFPDLDGAARYCKMQLEIDEY